MDKLKFIERVALTRGLKLTREMKNKISMRLAHAGFINDIPDDQHLVVKDIIIGIVKRDDAQQVQKTAGITKTASAAMCPRCNMPCSDVKLADATPVKYCTSCRIALP